MPESSRRSWIIEIFLAAALGALGWTAVEVIDNGKEIVRNGQHIIAIENQLNAHIIAIENRLNAHSIAIENRLGRIESSLDRLLVHAGAPPEGAKLDGAPRDSVAGK